MRCAQVFNDSLRRNRATAKSAPSFSMAAIVDGGSWESARAAFGMHIEYVNRPAFANIYIYVCGMKNDSKAKFKLVSFVLAHIHFDGVLTVLQRCESIDQPGFDGRSGDADNRARVLKRAA